MTPERRDSDNAEAPVTEPRTPLANHKLTMVLLGLAVGFILLVALNMN
jgi:hypothetical protein